MDGPINYEHRQSKNRVSKFHYRVLKRKYFHETSNSLALNRSLYVMDGYSLWDYPTGPPYRTAAVMRLSELEVS